MSFKFRSRSEFGHDVSLNEFQGAVETIAQMLDRTEPTRQRDGEVIDKNPMAFPQKRVLNGLAYGIALALQTTQGALTNGMARAKTAARNHRGDELSEETLVRALGWVERLQEQEVVLTAMLDCAVAAHEFYTGEEFMPPRPAGSQPRSEFVSPALERARKLGIAAANEAPQTNGVQTLHHEDDGHVQARPQAEGGAPKAPIGVTTSAGVAKLVKKPQQPEAGNGQAG